MLLATLAAAETSRRPGTLTLSLSGNGTVFAGGRELGRAREAHTADQVAGVLAQRLSGRARIVIDGAASAADAAWLIGEATDRSNRTHLVGVRGGLEWIPTSAMDGLYTPPKVRFG